MSAGGIAITGGIPTMNPRGIPNAPFIVSAPKTLEKPQSDRSITQADVEEYIGGPDGEVEGPLKTFQDALAYASMSS